MRRLRKPALRDPGLDAADVDIFHCDVMDGSLAPNITMGLMDIKVIRAATDKSIDCRLMIEQPSRSIDLFLDAGADINRGDAVPQGRGITRRPSLSNNENAR